MSPWKLGIAGLLATCAACAHAPALPGRYLYEVTCDAVLSRFDTVEKQKTATMDLAKRPGTNGLIPISSGVLEVCLARSTVFDPGASAFYTLVPTTVQPDADGKVSYRLLSFSVPQVELITQSSAGRDLQDPPRLELASGQVRIVPPDEPVVFDVDLSTFAPDRRPFPNRIVESSGERVLLRFNESDADVFAVADRQSKRLVRLQDLPRTDLNSIHLSPGGAIVLAEEISRPGRPAPKTGHLVLVDAHTDLVVKALDDPGIVGLFYRGMAPTGVALYRDSERDRFVDLGMSFPADAVVVSPLAEFAAPGIFFAGR